MSKPKKSGGPAISYLKYSGLAIQMFVILAIGFFLGRSLDNYFGLEKPYLALTLCFLFLIGIFYKIIKDSSAGNI